ncbi:MAG: hypothetical protein WCO96_00310 [Actinomycetes bacterium]
MNTVARDILTAIAVFVVVTAVAMLIGASSLGVAATFGQIAFAGAVLWLMLRR